MIMTMYDDDADDEDDGYDDHDDDRDDRRREHGERHPLDHRKAHICHCSCHGLPPLTIELKILVMAAGRFHAGTRCDAAGQRPWIDAHSARAALLGRARMVWS